MHRFKAEIRCLVAVASIALTLVLTCAVVSETLHEWLHGDAGHDADKGCAITLFAAGVLAAGAVTTVAAPVGPWRTLWSAGFQTLFLVAPRYLRQPERGPPTS